ncbi:FAD:protein FMN transferase [Pedobacter psychroterrae]|uniref:FAD:protein FMN transferase n=1 Tax=Pedobacter psychroterrae TaxID=2530453 RepID=UPI001CED222C|nr:FAD:protein FMN transferase [Pedobacter psychroterrae]
MVLSIIRCYILFLLPLFFFIKEEQRQYVIQGYAQGTDYTIKYFAADSVVSKAEIDSILVLIDSSMSLYKPYSQINKFNNSEAGLRLDKHFQKVIKRSFEISKDTRGKFDVTVAPLVQAWGFGAKAISGFPDSLEIKRLLEFTGMKYLRLKKDYLSKWRPEVKVDLNGIAQGYSVDVVADHLISRGLKSFVVEIGGELRMKGPKPDGTAFRVGIEGPSPVANAEPVMRHVVALNEGAITTSGNYRKFLQRGSKKITHLIDPKTGYPLENTMISVTVYAKDAITADGYDNALMGMDMKSALAFVAVRKGMEVYMIYHRPDGSVADTLSKGFKRIIAD